MTGPQGPDDFIGTIDRSDWASSSYNAIVFGKTFWIRKPSSNDTLYFGGRSAGDSIAQSLRIYNEGSEPLSVSAWPGHPFRTSVDSVEIQPSMLGSIEIFFILPDTSGAIFNSTLTLRFSTQDSVILHLKGYRTAPDTGEVVINAPAVHSFPPAYPNPTDGQITFLFTVPQTSDVMLTVVDKQNKVLDTIAQGSYIAGTHSVSWQAALPNGNYRALLRGSNFASQGDIQISK